MIKFNIFHYFDLYLTFIEDEMFSQIFRVKTISEKQYTALWVISATADKSAFLLW